MRSAGLRPRWLAVAALFAALGLGCGDGRPDRVPVSGRVLIDGEPLTHGYIRFVPAQGRPSGGRIGEDGRFTLSCYMENDGAIRGVHRVEVDATESISSRKLKWHAPKKYFRYNTSGIEQEITEATDTLEIELSWEGGEPFVERLR